jgi:hypothetical protein
MERTPVNPQSEELAENRNLSGELQNEIENPGDGNPTSASEPVKEPGDAPVPEITDINVSSEPVKEPADAPVPEITDVNVSSEPVKEPADVTVPEISGDNDSSEPVKVDEPVAKTQSEVKSDAAPVEHEEEKHLEVITEHTEEIEHDHEPLENYAQLSKEDLLQRMESFSQENDVNAVKNRIGAIKDAFQHIIQLEKDALLAAFLVAGGIKEEFEPRPDPIEEKFFDLHKKYQKRRNDFLQSQEKVRQDNLKAKQDILHSMKNILQQEEDMSRAFNEFHDLQARWRSIGPVPSASVNDLWMTYKLYSDRFYEFIKINRELQDLEMKKNLEMKMQLCERAEELLLEPSLNKALHEAQTLQHKWREIGAVPREKRTEIWLRFKGVLDKVFEHKRNYLDGQKQQFENNLKLKTELCEKAEAILATAFDKHNSWQEGLKKILELQTEWRKIGPAGKEHNDSIWQRFKASCDQFFRNKDAFYKRRKQEYAANLQQKTELCIQAEALKESEDWKTTTNELVRLQQEWKKIGPAGEKNEKIWQRFKTACDAFFNRKSAHFSDQDSQQGENLIKKEALIAEVLAYKIEGDASANLEHLKDFQRRFTGIGLVPLANKDDIQKRFRDAVQQHFDALKTTPGYRRPQGSRPSGDRPRERHDRHSSHSHGGHSHTQHAGSDEQRNLMNKVSKLSSEVSTLENNLGFFAKTKNASALREEYEQKIQQAKEEIARLKSRLTELRNA